MRVLLLLLSIEFTVFICLSQMQTILRTTPHDPTRHLDDILCDQTSINSSYPNGCDISCAASSSCGASTELNAPNIICPPVSGSKCIIRCQGQASCKYANIQYNINTDIPIPNLTILLLCNGADSCENVTINAPEQSNVTVICDGQSNECSSLSIDASTANFVSLQCANAVCNHMDIYCPSYSNALNIPNNKNCLIDCSKATNCNDNDIYIKENNLDADNIGLLYKCSTIRNVCNSNIICDYEENTYNQQCKWYKYSKWSCNTDDECHGELTIGFLSGWSSVSTLVFVIMLAFGFIIVLGIFIYSMKEKYDEYTENKEKHRKRQKRTTTKNRAMERRSTLLGETDNNNNNNNTTKIYGKGHKLSGSYYVAPKKNKKHKKNKYEDTIDEKAEYQYKPSQIQILDEYHADE
eukprot:208360_1